MWHALRGTGFDLDLDIEKVLEAEQVFRECMKDYFTPPEALAVEPLIPWSPMPGGALTANTQMMRDHGILDRYREVINAMSEVVARGGFGTSVTPLSQFYFQQAFNNVMFGPWQRIAEGYGRTVLGYYGRTPVPPDPEIVRIASAQLGLEPTTRSPLEMNDANPAKGIAPARRRLEEAGLPVTDENVFIVATCGDKGLAFLQGKSKVNVRKIEPEPEAVNRYTVTVDGVPYAVILDDGRVVVDGRDYAVDVREGVDETAAVAAAAPAPGASPAGGIAIESKLPGTVVRILAKPGESVAVGATVVVLEAMKMEIDVKAPRAGVIASIDVAIGDQVPAGHVLARLR
ncbi:MAG TPA: biotin/lipoyl-containing protein, partial [Longimicrobiales bacterium]|nr:biotin/lipoyl-containing protein [Longimicrobiales bacterium]